MNKITIAVALVATCNIAMADDINWPKLFQAVGWKESTNNVNAYNAKEKAIGILQIRPICIKDLRRKHKHLPSDLKAYTARYLSYKAFILYGRMYGARTAEEFCRIWNGGPRGMQKKATKGYWKAIEKEYKK